MDGLPLFSKTDSSTDLFQTKKTQYMVEIRQKKRDYDITLKRLKLSHRIYTDDGASGKKSRDPSLVIKDFFDSIQDGDLLLAENATAEIRECIAKPTTSFNQVYDLFMESGVIQNMINLLSKKYASYPKLQEEVSCALCNFTAGDSIYVEYALKNHVLENLMQALDFATGKFLENCLWTLSNMVGESKAIKDSVLAMDSIERITEIIYTNQKQIGILRTAIWLLSNLTQGVSYDLVKAISRPLPLIAELCSCQDEVVIENTLWTFCYFCEDLEAEKAAFAVGTGIVKIAIKLLAQQTNSRIRSLAFRLCSYIILANASFSQILNEKHYLSTLVSYLKDFKFSWCKEACKTLASLIMKYPAILEMAKEMELFSHLAEALTQGNTDTRIEAMICWHNIFSKCDENALANIVSTNVFAGVSKGLESINPELIITSLNTLQQILQRTQINCQKLSAMIFQKLREANVINLVEGLISSKNETIAEKAIKLIDVIFKCTN